VRISSHVVSVMECLPAKRTATSGSAKAPRKGMDLQSQQGLS
jgi:hypothetical protein